MNIKDDKNNKDNIQEASFVEIHYDENGNEYRKYPLSMAPLLHYLPLIYTVLLTLCALVVIWNTYVGFGLGLVLAISIKPVKNMIARKMCASGKYYDNGKFGKF